MWGVMGPVTTMFVVVTFLLAVALVMVRSVEAWAKVEIEREKTRLRRVEVELASIEASARVVNGYQPVSPSVGVERVSMTVDGAAFPPRAE
jgi:hypothetical protein